MSTLRVAVVSDSHATIREGRDSYTLVEPPPQPMNQQPLADLARFISRKGLKADLVICPGDLANKADPQGRNYAWNALQDLAIRLDARQVIATPGNHDVVTHTHVPDPAAALKLLTPSFPTGDPSVDTAFWQDGFVILERDRFRILVLNSCFGNPTHPGATARTAAMRTYYRALNRGSFPTEVQVKLEPRLAALSELPVNIAVLHHHPTEHESRELFKDSYGPMRRGSELIRILEENNNAGRWFVLHGHKHVPRLVSVASTGANGPVVMGAASVGGKLWHPVVTVTRNQFHIIEFELESRVALADLRGSVESYMWCYGDGWKIASRSGSGLPPRCGFGIVVDPRVLARQVAEAFTDATTQSLKWEVLADANPALDYQSPRDFDMFETQLEAVGFLIERDGNERIRQVAREVN